MGEEWEERAAAATVTLVTEEATFYCLVLHIKGVLSPGLAAVAWWIECLPVSLKVAGSIPPCQRQPIDISLTH